MFCRASCSPKTVTLNDAANCYSIDWRLVNMIFINGMSKNLVDIYILLFPISVSQLDVISSKLAWRFFEYS